MATGMMILVACTPKEPAQPERTSSRIEQLKMQSRMKALAAEVVKLRDSRDEVDALKASIAAMDSQIAVYQKLLDEKEDAPQVQVVAQPKDPDLINLKGNIYVLNREIDSLKDGMVKLEVMNDSLEIQIEQLAVQTQTEVERMEPANEQTVAEYMAAQETAVAEAPAESQPVLKEEPAMKPKSKAQGFTYKADYRMAYNDALNRYFNKEYLEAIEEFRLLIDREPDGAYADNAQYWIGECYYSLENYPTAIIEFTKVFSFPENNKSDHALFKIALSYHQLGRYKQAIDSMNRFVYDYPYSELLPQAKDFLADNQ